MDTCRSSNHRVLDQFIRPTVHDAAPFPKTRGVHRQDLIRGSELIYPKLDLARPGWILASSPLDSRLQFTHRHSRKQQLLVLLVAEPGDHCAVRMRLSQ